MKNSWVWRNLTLWSVLGGLAVMALLLVIWWLLLRTLLSPVGSSVEPMPILNIIPAPTATLPAALVLPPTTTPTLSPLVGMPGTNEKIKIGDFVQISGTGGDGLRIRSGAGTQNPPLFLGMEAEAFQVMDGPKEADGITWWYLLAPYDENRKGWAASNYLSILATRP